MTKRIILTAVFLLFVLACGSTGVLPTLAPTADFDDSVPTATYALEPTKTPFPTETPTQQIMCTPPACNEDEIYFCPDACPGGCGTICVTVTPSITGGVEAQVVEIIDGDTIDVEAGGAVYRVRYIGIDTPERGMPFYQEATEANADLVAGQTVILVKDISETDRYNRLLRYVYLQDGRMVNAELVRLGFAQQATYPPDVKHEDLFNQLALEARANELGLWANPP